MKNIKKFFSFEINTSVILLVFGLLLAIFPAAFTALVFNILGALAMAAGVFSFIKYLRNTAFFSTLVYAISSFVLGIILITSHADIISILPIIAGIILLVNGIRGITRVFEYKSHTGKFSTALVITSAITLAGGILLLANPFGSAMLTLRIIGAFVAYSAVQNLFGIGYIKKQADKNHPIEGTFSEDESN